MRGKVRIFALIMAIIFAATMLTGLGISLFYDAQPKAPITNQK
ncbi:MAG: hypothetical protein WCL54_03885 [Clostridia bacterium]